MSEPFLSEIKIMAFVYAPRGWALCNGQFLPINQNQALFALLGTTYGGNGQTTFALPNLRGRVPIHFDDSHNLGEAAGATSNTITSQTMPAHNHFVNVTNNNGAVVNPAGAYLGAVNAMYGPLGSSLTTMNPASVTNTGGSQAHTNMQPYLTLSFCIALIGIFPSRN
jgi:microcystin-dependent protein